MQADSVRFQLKPQAVARTCHAAAKGIPGKMLQHAYPRASVILLGKGVRLVLECCSLRIPAASQAPRPLPTIASRRLRWPGLRWPAAAPISPLMDQEAAAPTFSRPAPSVGTMRAQLISPARWPYGWQDITTDRTVTITGVDQLRARFNANALSGRVQGGDRFVTPWMGSIGLTPYAAGQSTTFDLPAYAEQILSGANTFALAYGSKSATERRDETVTRNIRHET
jgi:hypothetical protein